MSTVGKNMIIKMKNSVLFRGLNNSSGNIIVEIPDENKRPNRKKIIFLNRSQMKSLPKNDSLISKEKNNYLQTESENEDANKILKYYKKINEIRKFRIINGNQEKRLDITGNMIPSFQIQHDEGLKLNNNQTISVEISKKVKSKDVKSKVKNEYSKNKLFKKNYDPINNVIKRNLKMKEYQNLYFQTSNNNEKQNLTDHSLSFLSIKKCQDPKSLQKSFSFSQSLINDNKNLHAIFPKINSIHHYENTQKVSKGLGLNPILKTSNVRINQLVKKQRDQQIFILKNGLKNLRKF